MLGLSLDFLALALAQMAYNRDAYANNVAMDQNQAYQEKNYLITFITSVREELRDVMSIYVARMGNYIMVSTLLFGFAAVLLAEGPDFMGSGESPQVLVQIFAVSICLTLVSLVSGVLCALKGLATSYEQAMGFLAEFLPEAPDEYDFNYMEQCTRGFEQSGEVWRLPLVDYPWWCLPSPLRSRWPRRDSLSKWMGREDCRLRQPRFAESETVLEQLPRRKWPHSQEAGKDLEAGEAQREDRQTEGPSRSEPTDDQNFNSYFSQIESLANNWEPYKHTTRVFLAHSVMEFIQALAYFSLGRYHNCGMHIGTVLCLMISSLSAVVMWQLRDWHQLHDGNEVISGRRMFLAVLVSGSIGPAVCAAMIFFVAPDLHPVIGMFCSLLYVLREAFLISLVPVHRQVPEVSSPKQSGVPDGRFSELCPTARERIGQELCEETQKHRELSEGPQRRGNFIKHLEKVVEQCKRKDALKIKGLGPVERRVIRHFDSFSCFWWMASFVLFGVALYEPLQSRRRARVRFEGAGVVTEELEVEWPSKRYRPHALACAGARTFIADNFNVYELALSQGPQARHYQLQPWPCDLARRIADIAVACDAEGCRPMVLLQGQPAQVVDCATGEALPLLQVSGHVEHIALWNATRILTMEGGELLLRRRGRVNLRDQLQPLWPVAEAPQHAGALRAVDAAGGEVVSFFYAAGEADSPAMMRLDVQSGALRAWEMPSGLLTGCSPIAGSALALIGGGDGEQQQRQQRQPRIVRLRLDPY